jgi:hypothetical protein
MNEIELPKICILVLWDREGEGLVLAHALFGFDLQTVGLLTSSLIPSY